MDSPACQPPTRSHFCCLAVSVIRCGVGSPVGGFWWTRPRCRGATREAASGSWTGERRSAKDQAAATRNPADVNAAMLLSGRGFQWSMIIPPWWGSAAGACPGLAGIVTPAYPPRLKPQAQGERVGALSSGRGSKQNAEGGSSTATIPMSTESAPDTGPAEQVRPTRRTSKHIHYTVLRSGRVSHHGQVLTGTVGCLFCSVAAPRGRTSGPWPLVSKRHKMICNQP